MSSLVLACFAWACGGELLLAAEPPSRRPKVLLIFADDQRWDTIRALGIPEIQTPHLDRLVERGHHFTNAYCTGSMVPAVCTPSRTMLLTGRSLWRIPDPRARSVPAGVTPLPTALRNAGYATWHCGKRGNSCGFAHAAFETNLESTARTAASATEHADRAIEFLQHHDGSRPFFMSSDQGLAVGGRHGLMGKQNLYEHFKSPLVMAGPGIPHGQSAALVYLFDLFPTTCEIAGAEVPASVEGHSLLPIVHGQQKKVRDSLLCGYRECQRMVRDERWKLIEYRAADGRHTQLFDLARDPDELSNLAVERQFAAERARLEGLMRESQQTFADPIDF